MRGNMSSTILAFICIGFIVGSAYSFMVPNQMDQLILVGNDFGILDDLTAPFHTSFPWRSYNQSIDIFFACANGSLDVIIIKSTEWDAWYTGENYSAIYEASNVTNIMTSVKIEPSYYYTIDVILETNYGDAQMDINISSHWLGYNDTNGATSLLVALPFAIGSFYYAPKKSNNTAKSSGVDIS